MTMPSGSDSDGYSLDGHDGAIVGSGMSSLATRTESNVRAEKSATIEGNDVFSSILGALFGGISGGLPGLFSALIGGLLGINPADYDTIDEIIGALEQVPILGDIIHLVESLLDALGLTGTGSLLDMIEQLADGILGWLLGTEDTAAALDNLVSVVENILNSIIPGLGDAIDNVIDFIRQILDALIAGVRGIPLFGPALAAALGAIGFSAGEADPDVIAGVMAGVTEALQLQRAQAENFTSSSYAAAARNPAWVCRYPVADVSYPEAFHFKFPVFGDTGAQSAGTAHTHIIDGNDATAGNTAVIIPQGQSWGGYIGITNTAVMDTVGIIIARNAGTLNNVFLEVFRELADTSLIRLTSTNITSSIPLVDPIFLEVSIAGGLIAQAGERYMVRVRNSSTVATTVELQCVKRIAAVSPEIGFGTPSPPTLQTTYTAAEAVDARAGDVVPWVMLASKAQVDPDVSYSDDFNRINLGPDWVTSGTDAIIISGGKATFGGATNGDEQALYIRRTNGDASMVRGNLYVDEAATTQQFGLRLHCDRDVTQSVELLVTGTDAKIYSYASGTPTQRATVAVGGTDLYSLYYDEPNDKYVALKGGAEFDLEWTGVGSAVDHGPDFRFGGNRIVRASGVNAGTIDNWTLTDYWAA